jgi:hypothetical protein
VGGTIEKLELIENSNKKNLHFSFIPTYRQHHSPAPFACCCTIAIALCLKTI